MNTKYILLFICVLSLITADTHSQLVFLNQFNGGGGGSNASNAITADGSGNSYVTGYTTGLTSMHDITTLKYDASGRLIWARSYNGTGNNTDEAYAITIDNSGNIYVAGSTTGLLSDKDMIIIKYNNSGVQQWAKIYSSPGIFPDEAYAITLDASGDPIISGYSYLEGSGNVMTIIKYDVYGNQTLFTTGSGASGSTDVAYAITVDAGDNMYVTGYEKAFLDATTNNKSIVTVKFSPAGVRQWSKTITGAGNGDNEPSSMATDQNGNTYVTGYVTAVNGDKDYVTVKYDVNGNQVWMKTYNNSSANDDDIPRKIIIDQRGDVVVTGSSKHSHNSNTEDYLTIKYSGSSGSQQFTHRYTEPSVNSTSIAYSLTEYKRGKYYITGSSRQTTSAGSEDIVTLELDKNGSYKGKFRIANPGPDAGYDIVADESGNFTLAGYLSGNETGMSSGDMTNMSCARYNDNNSGDNSYIGIFSVVNNTENNLIALKSLETNIPKSFNLYQNYPNPFNPSTVIKFDVSQSSIVKIVIYDILGKEVLTPVNDYMNPGTYEVTVSLSNLSSEMYFYKMTSGSFTDIKKMVLVK